MSWAMERTASEIYSFSPWATMTRAMGRTDGEIIQSPTELSGPGPRRGQTARYIHSPTEL